MATFSSRSQICASYSRRRPRLCVRSTRMAMSWMEHRGNRDHRLAARRGLAAPLCRAFCAAAVSAAGGGRDGGGVLPACGRSAGGRAGRAIRPDAVERRRRRDLEADGQDTGASYARRLAGGQPVGLLLIQDDAASNDSMRERTNVEREVQDLQGVISLREQVCDAAAVSSSSSTRSSVSSSSTHAAASAARTQQRQQRTRSGGQHTFPSSPVSRTLSPFTPTHTGAGGARGGARLVAAGAADILREDRRGERAYDHQAGQQRADQRAQDEQRSWPDTREGSAWRGARRTR